MFVKNAIFLYFFISIFQTTPFFSLSLSSNRVPHTLINFIPHSPNKTKRKNMTWQHSNREKKKTPVEAWTLVSEFYEICLLWVYRRGGRFYTNLEIPLSRTTLFFFWEMIEGQAKPELGNGKFIKQQFCDNEHSGFKVISSEYKIDWRFKINSIQVSGRIWKKVEIYRQIFDDISSKLVSQISQQWKTVLDC